MLLAGDVGQRGQRIREARKELELSIQDLSRRTGVSSATISEIENDKRENPRRETILKLTEALGMDVDIEHGVVGGPMWMVRDGLWQLGLPEVAVNHVMGTIEIWQAIENGRGGKSNAT